MSGVATVPGRGRKPKPQETKKTLGNKGKRPLKTNVPEFIEVTDIEVPEYISVMDHAAMMWRSIIPELLKNKVFRITDMHNVEAFCIADCKKCRGNHFICKWGSGWKCNPYKCDIG
ncbi:hypothetical protein HWI77_06895 [Acinetobacter venetianus]|nr:hypothetical protein HWI77_06895 [Acinetobacter venetianus]